MKKLIVISGPTGVGKTKVAIEVAKHFNTEILSADSRQFFKEIPIGTAAPTQEEQAEIPHHFVGNLSITEYYNAYKYEQAVLKLLQELFKQHDYIVLTGGSGMYIDAVCNGIDDIPDVDSALRSKIKQQYLNEGLESLQNNLKQLDPEYYTQVDLKNPVRLMRAIEVCLQTGKPYTQVRTNTRKKRDFEIIKIALNLPREELYERINQRVIIMQDNGLVDEVNSVKSFKEHTALKTVGYRELFDYFEGNCTLENAIEKIQQNSRKYAKRQLTWLKRDLEYRWFSPTEIKEIINCI